MTSHGGKEPDYFERSKLIQDECDNDVALKQARHAVFHDLVESVQQLKALRGSSDESVALAAIKHHLKLAGLEVEHVKYDGVKVQICLPPQDGGELGERLPETIPLDKSGSKQAKGANGAIDFPALPLVIEPKSNIDGRYKSNGHSTREKSIEMPISDLPLDKGVK